MVLRDRSHIGAIDRALRCQRLRYRFSGRCAGLQASPQAARSSAPALPTGGRGCRLVGQTVQYRAPITRRTRYRSGEATSTNGKRPLLIGVTVSRARQISPRRCSHGPVVRVVPEDTRSDGPATGRWLQRSESNLLRLVLEHRLNLLAQLRRVLVPVNRGGMLYRRVEHFFFRAGNLERAILFARVIPA